MANLHTNIKNKRLQLGLTQEELARRLGYTNKSTIAKIEAGKSDLPQSKIAEFAAALHTTPAQLMGWETAKTQTKALRINVYGSIPAGVPLEALENIEDWEEIPAEMADGGKEFIALKVKGDSMWPKYLENDVVIIQLQPDCESGEDCAVYVNGYDATLKTVKKSEHTITLKPINPNYAPKTYSHPGEVTVLGKVIELRRKIGL